MTSAVTVLRPPEIAFPRPAGFRLGNAIFARAGEGRAVSLRCVVGSLLPVAAAVAIAVIVPGPNVVAVVTSAARDRRAGMLTALGASTGDMVWAAAALLGLGAVLASARPVFVAVKWAGAIYLVAFAVRLLTAAHAPGGDDAAPGVPHRPFVRGLLVDLANPKAAVFFTSLFVSLLPGDVSWGLGLATLAVVAVVDYAWYLLLAGLISRPAPQRWYRRRVRAVNRVAAGVVGVLGVRLALSD